MEEILTIRNKNLPSMIKYLFLITDKVQAAKTINNDNKFGFFFYTQKCKQSVDA